MAKKWKDAKNKLVLKDKIFSNVVMGSGGGDQFEFKDETFRQASFQVLIKFSIFQSFPEVHCVAMYF